MYKKNLLNDAFFGWTAICVMLIIFAGHLYFLYSINYKDFEYMSTLEENISFLQKENADLKDEIEITHKIYREKIGIKINEKN